MALTLVLPIGARPRGHSSMVRILRPQALHAPALASAASASAALTPSSAAGTAPAPSPAAGAALATSPVIVHGPRRCSGPFVQWLARAFSRGRGCGPFVRRRALAPVGNPLLASSR